MLKEKLLSNLLRYTSKTCLKTLSNPNFSISENDNNNKKSNGLIKIYSKS